MTRATHLRDAALEAQTHAADPRMIAAVDIAIERLLESGKPWSADDVRPMIPTAALPLVGGHVRSYLMRRHPRVIDVVGEVQSTWPAAHGKRIGLYRAADEAEQVAS
tara:strand:+ start:4967 stop:5287 length:321 start_codon:yes stop_codon:yes gene_type:complete